MPRTVEVEAPYLDQLLNNKKLLRQILSAIHAGTEVDIIIDELLGGEKYGITLSRCGNKLCAYIYADSTSSINPLELEKGYGVQVAEIKIGDITIGDTKVSNVKIYGTQNSATDEFYAVAEGDAELPLPRNIQELEADLDKLYAIYDKMTNIADEYIDKALKLVKEEVI